jgi:hypothetical protein
MQYFKPARRHPLMPCLLFAALSQAADAPLDEVVVESTRGKLKEMVQEMVKIEDQFYERYNELNTNDDFDMRCAEEARIGTKLKRRYCRPVYENNALRDEAYQYYWQLSSYTDPTPKPEAPPVPAIVAIEARREEYKDNLRKVASEHPELVKLLQERYEMGQRYEATRRKVWGLKPPPEEEEAAPAD